MKSKRTKSKLLLSLRQKRRRSRCRRISKIKRKSMISRRYLSRREISTSPSKPVVIVTAIRERRTQKVD
jgi:hypothetical protein